MRAKPDQFDWMREAIYEPRQAITPRPEPIPLGWKVFFTVAALFIVCCGLAALAI